MTKFKLVPRKKEDRIIHFVVHYWKLYHTSRCHNILSSNTQVLSCNYAKIL